MDDLGRLQLRKFIAKHILDYRFVDIHSNNHEFYQKPGDRKSDWRYVLPKFDDNLELAFEVVQKMIDQKVEFFMCWYTEKNLWQIDFYTFDSGGDIDCEFHYECSDLPLGICVGAMEFTKIQKEME